jgi:hypothetical protein
VKRAIQIAVGAVLVCLVAFFVITESGLGGPPNPLCPSMNTDPFGFPIVPNTWSDYPTTGSTGTETPIISVLKSNLPCCAIIADDGTFTLVPADGVLERCLIPSVQVFPGETCPAVVDVTMTIDVGGAVRNCLEFNPGQFAGGFGGGGSLFILTGNNAG